MSEQYCKSNKIIKCTKLKCKAYLVQGKETENLDLPIWHQALKHASFIMMK